MTTLYVFLSRFQAKGMDIGVADESLNGIPYEESSESEEEEEAEETEGEETKKHLIEIETLRSPMFRALSLRFFPSLTAFPLLRWKAAVFPRERQLFLQALF